MESSEIFVLKSQETCKHWRGVLKLITLLQGCVAAVREGNGKDHFHAIQRLPVFCTSGSINYLRSWYLEKRRKMFREGKCLVRTNLGYFKSVALDMKLQESKKYLIFQKKRRTRMFLVQRWKVLPNIANISYGIH